MDNQNNQEQVNQTSDMRSVEPTVIGYLRKDKIGDPTLAIVLGIMLITSLFALPYVTKLIQTDEGVQQVLNNAPVTSVDDFSYADASVNQQLSYTLVMKTDNIVMRGFTINEDSINCKINSFNGVINLDKEDYYLVIASKQGNDLGYIKLVGSFDYQETEITLSSSSLRFNKTLSYFGRIVKMTEADYPDYVVPVDETGVGVLSCKKDLRTVTYSFKDNKVVTIEDQKIVKTADYPSLEKYVYAKKEYDTKASTLGNIASVEEGQDGFVFRATIDLNTKTIPESISDYEYYGLNTDAKVIQFEMTSKGYECK